MKIILVSPVFSDLGISTISPLLKREGHEVKLLFLPELLRDCMRPLSDKLTGRIKEFISEADIVGINGFSENYHKTANLIDAVKRATKVPFVWGGIHATLRPQDCIKHADVVCIGEGEQAMIELARKMEKKERIENIRNLLFNFGADNPGGIDLYMPIDLDSLLPLDYDLDSQYTLENNKIRGVKERDFKEVFFSYTSRGCPFRCSYCCNEVVLNMYKGRKFCRQRSIENVINELKDIKNRFSSCKMIWFNEADFLAGKTEEEIGIFSKRYRKDIDLPFVTWSNPDAVKDEDMRILKYAGLEAIGLGTINGSKNSQWHIYKRSATAKSYRTKAEILNKYGIKVEYDFILCNPYEDDEDIISTIELLMQLPKPFRVVIFNLTYFPGTELYEKALEDGVIKRDGYIQSYTKAGYRTWKFRSNTTYLNIVASMLRGQARRIDFLGLSWYGVLPEPLLKLLIKRPVIKFFNHLPLRFFIYDKIASLIIISYAVIKKISYFAKRFLSFLRKD